MTREKGLIRLSAPTWRTLRAPRDRGAFGAEWGGPLPAQSTAEMTTAEAAKQPRTLSTQAFRLPMSKRARNVFFGVRAMLRLWRNPSDSPHAVVVLQAFRGASGARMCRQLTDSATGRRILSREENIASVLNDLEYLRRLPEGSLGRAYLSFMEDTELTLEGLVDSVARSAVLQAPEVRNMSDHLRDTHDLWHVLFGYGTDELGEMCLACVSYAQTQNPGMALIILASCLKILGREPSQMQRFWEAYDRGRSADWIPPTSWRELLPRPLDEVRASLGVKTMGLRRNTSSKVSTVRRSQHGRYPTEPPASAR